MTLIIQLHLILTAAAITVGALNAIPEPRE
jgi:hypothetical protein